MHKDDIAQLIIEIGNALILFVGLAAIFILSNLL
jgi:hypothetical protein